MDCIHTALQASSQGGSISKSRKPYPPLGCQWHALLRACHGQDGLQGNAVDHLIDISTSSQSHLSSARDLPCVSVPEHPSQSISGGRSRPGALPALSRTGRHLATLVHGGQCQQVAASDVGVVRRRRRALRGGQGARVDSRCHRAFSLMLFSLIFFFCDKI